VTVPKKLGGLPVWAWGVAAAAGLLLGYMLVRRGRTAVEQAPPRAAETGSNLTGGELAQLVAGLSAGEAAHTAAPVESLALGTLALLGEQLGLTTNALVSQGYTLGSITMGAHQAIVDLASGQQSAALALIERSYQSAPVVNVTTPPPTVVIQPPQPLAPLPPVSVPPTTQPPIGTSTPPAGRYIGGTKASPAIIDTTTGQPVLPGKSFGLVYAL
jgi:hypothetical protein